MKKSIFSIASLTILVAGFYPAYVFLLGQFLFVDEGTETGAQIEETKESREELSAQ